MELFRSATPSYRGTASKPSEVTGTISGLRAGLFGGAPQPAYSIRPVDPISRSRGRVGRLGSCDRVGQRADQADVAEVTATAWDCSSCRPFWARHAAGRSSSMRAAGQSPASLSRTSRRYSNIGTLASSQLMTSV
jgi:hypothetical protein